MRRILLKALRKGIYMRDLDKDFGENNVNNSYDRENKDLFDEETGNVQNNKDLEEGSCQDK